MVKDDLRAFLKDGHITRMILRDSEFLNIAHGHTLN